MYNSIMNRDQQSILLFPTYFSLSFHLLCMTFLLSIKLMLIGYRVILLTIVVDYLNLHLLFPYIIGYNIIMLSCATVPS